MRSRISPPRTAWRSGSESQPHGCARESAARIGRVLTNTVAYAATKTQDEPKDQRHRPLTRPGDVGRPLPRRPKPRRSCAPGQPHAPATGLDGHGGRSVHPLWTQCLHRPGTRRWVRARLEVQSHRARRGTMGQGGQSPGREVCRAHRSVSLRGGHQGGSPHTHPP